MAPRSSWKGFLRLSLVSVPVRAFTANNTTEEIRLNQLHDECHSRVRYQKICPEHGVLKSDQIVSGYEFTKDQYVVIDPDEIAKLRTQSDKAVNIDGFIKPEEIDPVYLAGRTYYLLPDGPAGARPYALLLKGMQEKGVHAMAQIVLSGREQLVLVRPTDGMLTMSMLSYSKKIKPAAPFLDDIEPQETTAEEMTLAHTLIDASTISEFDYESYKDRYVEQLQKLIQMKVDGEEIVQAPDLEEPKIINLMDALKKSVAEAQSASGKKMAPSTKDASTAKKSARKKSG